MIKKLGIAIVLFMTLHLAAMQGGADAPDVTSKLLPSLPYAGEPERADVTVLFRVSGSTLELVDLNYPYIPTMVRLGEFGGYKHHITKLNLLGFHVTSEALACLARSFPYLEEIVFGDGQVLTQGKISMIRSEWLEAEDLRAADQLLHFRS